MDKSEHVPRKRTIELSQCVVNMAKRKSKRIPDCPRKNDGCIKHYVTFAILEQLKRDGVDLRKMYPGYYK